MIKRKGVVPVVAVVILIAVAVALGIAVAFWATGLIGTLGKVEKLEIRTAYASTSGSGWNIMLSGENTGTADVTIVEITVNGKPLSEYPACSATFTVGTTSYTYSNGISVSVPSGQDFTATIYVDGGFSHSQTIEIDLISDSGILLKRTIVLP